MIAEGSRSGRGSGPEAPLSGTGLSGTPDVASTRSAGAAGGGVTVAGAGGDATVAGAGSGGVTVAGAGSEGATVAGADSGGVTVAGAGGDMTGGGAGGGGVTGGGATLANSVAGLTLTGVGPGVTRTRGVP